jgi:hypothetical protein
MLNVFSKAHYAECRSTECRGAVVPTSASGEKAETNLRKKAGELFI